MGTARWEKEAEVREQEAQRRVRSERARRELELAEAEVAARIAALQRELQARRAELALVDAEDASREHGVGAAHDTILRLRGGVGDSQAVPAAAAAKRASASRPA